MLNYLYRQSFTKVVIATLLLAGSRVVWFVATEVPMWDERRLVQAWLDQHGVVTHEKSPNPIACQMGANGPLLVSVNIRNI